MSLGQNLIENAGFEEGTIPASNLIGLYAYNFRDNVPNWTEGCSFEPSSGNTPDILTLGALDCRASVPVNNFISNSNPLNPRIPGTTRYVYCGFSSNINKGESIVGKLNQNITAGKYDISFYGAKIQGYGYCNGTNFNYNPNDPKTRIEVVLRNSSNLCGTSQVVWTSDEINSSLGIWQLRNGSFTIDCQLASMNYDRIEFRIKETNGVHGIFIDDVSLTKVKLDSQISGNSTFCSGNPLTFSGAIISGASSISHLWEIQECTSSGSIIGNPIYGLWITGNPSSFTFPNSLNLPCNKYYRIKLAPSNNVSCEWVETTKIIKINCSPTINPIPPQTICSGSNVTFNVSTLPVKIYANGSYVGTYTSNPISFTPSITTSYSFVVINKYGCSNSTTTKVTVIQGPASTISGPSEFCLGDPLTFTGTLVSGYSLKHLWQIQNCDSNGNTLNGSIEYTSPWLYSPFPEIFTYNSSTTNIPANYIQPGYYRIKLVTLSAETNGCWGVTYKVIRILPTPTVSFQYPNGLNYLCNGDSISFYVDPSFFPINVFEGNYPIASFVSNPIIVSPTTTTTYTFIPDNNSKFNCSTQRTIEVKNCPKPCFEFLNVTSQNVSDSYYGQMVINEFCLPNEIFIDGSCSKYTSGYHLRISEFDLNNWIFVQDLFNNWVNGSGSVPSSINLNNLVAPNNFNSGKIYLVSLSTGPSWTSTPPQFFRVLDNCAKFNSNSSNDKKLNYSNNLNIYPNPTNDRINFTFDKNESGRIEIYSLEGKLVYSKEFKENNVLSANLNDYQAGVYIAKITIGDKTITKKIIKE